jgi:hypothetical protein
MTAQLVSFVSIIFGMAFWLVVLAAIFVPLERLFPLHRQKVFREQFWSDAAYYFINGLVPGLALGAPMILVVYASYKFLPGGVREAIADAPIWARAAAAMVTGETGLLLGAPAEPRDPVAVALSCDPSQRRTH